MLKQSSTGICHYVFEEKKKTKCGRPTNKLTLTKPEGKINLDKICKNCRKEKKANKARYKYKDGHGPDDEKDDEKEKASRSSKKRRTSKKKQNPENSDNVLDSVNESMKHLGLEDSD